MHADAMVDRPAKGAVDRERDAALHRRRG